MSEIIDQINLVEYIQLKFKLFKKELPKDIEEFTKDIILLIVDELEDNKNKWWFKWK